MKEEKKKEKNVDEIEIIKRVYESITTVFTDINERLKSIEVKIDMFEENRSEGEKDEETNSE